jgi:uncharacterized protein YjbI with pentapeptide repeats
MSQHQIKTSSGTVLYECDVPDHIASGLRTRHALEQATKAGADLADANLARANLARANLAGAYLASANLADANLADANLARANLASAYLAGADLAGADLAGANLASANLAGAYLASANLADANLAGANLARAYLARAYLASANLARANFASANLASANLAGAKWRDGITINRAPLQLHGLQWPVYLLDEHMQIGCELHTFAQWDEFDDARIVKMDRQALRFWRANKAALMALAATRTAAEREEHDE